MADTDASKKPSRLAKLRPSTLLNRFSKKSSSKNSISASKSLNTGTYGQQSTSSISNASALIFAPSQPSVSNQAENIASPVRNEPQPAPLGPPAPVQIFKPEERQASSDVSEPPEPDERATNEPQNSGESEHGIVHAGRPLQSSPIPTESPRIDNAGTRTDSHLVPSAADDTTPRAPASDVVAAAKAAQPPKSSYWDMAAESLKKDNPKLLEKVEKNIKDYEKKGQPDLMAMYEGRKRTGKGIPRWAERAIRSVLQFKELFAAAARFDPHKAAPAVLSGFIMILEVCINDSNLQRDVGFGVDTVTAKISHWANIELFYLSGDGTHPADSFKEVVRPLVKLYKAILELQAEMVGWCQEGTLSQIFDQLSGKKELWQKAVQTTTEAHSYCQGIFDDCKTKIDQHGKIKKWILDYRPDTTHTEVLGRTQVNEKYSACGQWLLDNDKFRTWSSQTYVPGKGVLWLRGTTGTGKTTLLARVIQWHLERRLAFKDYRFAYFYCSKTDKDLPDKTSYEIAIRALLRQAVYDDQTGEVFPNVLDIYKTSDSSDLKDFSLPMARELLSKLLQSGVKLRIMIDALDECKRPKELLKVLRDVSDSAPGQLELLVSSRNDVSVDDKFESAVPIDINTSMPDFDMVSYITSEVKEREHDERILKGESPDLEDELIKILRRRAGTMFRWVELQLSFFFQEESPFVFSDTVKGYLKKLDKASVADEKAIYDTYDDIFDHNTIKDTSERDVAGSILRMLLSSKEPFMMDNMLTALDLIIDNKTDDEVTDADILRLTRNFVYKADSSELKLAHPSVKDYLRRKPDYDDPKGSAEMAKMCLKHISVYNGTTYAKDLKANKLLRYSHTFWGLHCADSSKEARQEAGVSKLLLEWLVRGRGSTTFQTWRTALYVRGAILPETNIYFGIHFIKDPIFAACIWNLVEVVEELFSEQFEIEVALFTHGVSVQGQESPPSWLINAIKDFSLTKGDYADRSGWTPLLCAVEHGNEAMVKWLLDQDVEADFDQTKIRQTPASFSYKNPFTGSSKTRQSHSHWTPIFFAAFQGHVEVVKLLLEKKVKVDLKDLLGHSPLDYARQNGHEEVVKLLK